MNAPKLKRDWVGKRVRATREIRTGQYTVPAGRMGTVEGTYRGTFHVWFDGCKCCGVRVYVRLSSASSLEYMGDA